MKASRASFVAAGLLFVVVAAMASRSTSAQPPGITPYESRARHQFAHDYGIPEIYAQRRNPLPDTQPTWARGAAVYDDKCASCHGLSGEGKGPGALDLRTPPANLAWFATLPMSKWDGFMYWTIAEGGKPFGTAMPDFKDQLPEKDIWAVTAYVRRTLGTTRRS